MERIEYLDRAKALGMFLVYYGHFTEQLVQNHYDAALLQMKFIYSFHMPLFFFIAGIFWKPTEDLNQLFVSKIRTRIIPVFFWSLVLVPLWLVTISPQELLNKSLLYVSGFPALNGVTWFLVCLFSLEIILGLVGKRPVFNLPTTVLISIVSFLVGFLILIPLGVNWFTGEALVVMVFYLAGYSLRRILTTSIDLRRSILLLVTFGGILFLTYDLNTGPFAAAFPVVLLALLSHGNPWYFVLTAFAGILALLAFSNLLRFGRKPFHFISENLLVFLGLNGICFHFLNEYIVANMAGIPDTGLGVFLFSTIYVLVIMLLFSPIVVGIRRWIPELVGYPWSEHSLLPPLDGLFSKRFSKPHEAS